MDKLAMWVFAVLQVVGMGDTKRATRMKSRKSGDMILKDFKKAVSINGVN